MNAVRECAKVAVAHESLARASVVFADVWQATGVGRVALLGEGKSINLRRARGLLSFLLVRAAGLSLPQAAMVCNRMHHTTILDRVRVFERELARPRSWARSMLRKVLTIRGV